MRGTKGFSENLRLHDGVSESGVHTILHWEGDDFITQKYQDMEPVLKHVEAMRERNARRKRNEDMEVGHIPDLYLHQINAIPDPQDRMNAKLQFFRDHPAFCAYPGFLGITRQ